MRPALLALLLSGPALAGELPPEPLYVMSCDVTGECRVCPVGGPESACGRVLVPYRAPHVALPEPDTSAACLMVGRCRTSTPLVPPEVAP